MYGHPDPLMPWTHFRANLDRLDRFVARSQLPLAVTSADASVVRDLLHRAYPFRPRLITNARD